MEDPSRRKPWVFGISDSHTNIVTHVSIIDSEKIFQFILYTTLRYLDNFFFLLSFGKKFRLIHYSISMKKVLVSCYAFFKGWLPLSPPPNNYDFLEIFMSLNFF